MHIDGPCGGGLQSGSSPRYSHARRAPPAGFLLRQPLRRSGWTSNTRAHSRARRIKHNGSSTTGAGRQRSVGGDVSHSGPIFLGARRLLKANFRRFVVTEVGATSEDPRQRFVERPQKHVKPPISDIQPPSAEELSSFVLTKMKQPAEQFLNKKTNHAVITVPTYFNEAQRQATKDADQIAGLEVLRVINEPTAAALAYGPDRDDSSVIAVYALGGGTLLGLGTVLHSCRSIVPAKPPNSSSQQLLDLNSHSFRQIHYLKANRCHINMKFIRSQLESLVGPLIQHTVDPCKKALSDASVKASGIDDAILVGGMTRMPHVADTIKGIFGRDPSKDVNPDERSPSVPLSRVKSQAFSTAADGQTAIEVKISQGERELGRTQIEITFDIDTDGIVNVSAKDKATNKGQSVTIASSSSLSNKDIECIVSESEQYAETRYCTIHLTLHAS
ncbi:Hsp70 protein-domain-containing protein [Hygrophoropsis aurantiaca]|uniref:Hsp70 protein-domain-containing protein n=1 Tax=Hygrophoropsis aurantiaca TaxID=72124 RepID=A0ACB8AC81_9AGAM|nr:Hsp70 protein-domain-containing protein [Hygrophoropsis aurantiaca]